jgi:hypothetical protein
VAHSAEPVVHGNLAGGYAVSERFGKCTVVLRSVLYQDRSLSEAEFHFMENHFHVLEMAYLRWKRKHGNIGH